MSFEILVGLQVQDDELYQRYRDAMGPLLLQAGGHFRYDFKIAETLRSESEHPINRVFVLCFPDQATKEAFFASPEYRAVRTQFFGPSVAAVTRIAEYTRSVDPA